MCTLSFSPTRDGLLVAMNRDESNRRESAQPPHLFTLGAIEALYPAESSGGTWLAVNEYGLLLALLNRNGGGAHREGHRSRGLVIPGLIHTPPGDWPCALRSCRFDGMLPFTLVALDLAARRVTETAWDGVQPTAIEHSWSTRHWFSSGLSDAEATRVRGRTCQTFREHFRITADSLRELHRSHSPQRGAYSVCVHRGDAMTVSYSEIQISGSRTRFGYAPGSPCARAELQWQEIEPRSARLPNAVGY